MKREKRICETLKQIRQQVANANNICYTPTPCTHKGDCTGTCPTCEEEVRYIEDELNARRLLGKAVVVAGLSIGLSPLTAYGQELSLSENSSENHYTKEKVFVLDGVVEQMPSFPGGNQALMDYLSVNVKYPKECADSSIQGRVVCSFVVEKDGSLSEFKIMRSVHPLLDAEALRVVKQMPKWIPGKQNGTEASVKYTIPISFRINENEQ